MNMELFTKIDIPRADFRIDYTSNIVFIGSCFAGNISKRFAERKLHILTNPFGVLYNPLSIENLFRKIAEGDGESWCRWDYQGEFSREEFSLVLKTTRDFIAKADAIFITLGTAFVYFLKETGKAVANCHKEPAELFDRKLISVDEAASAIRNTIKAIHKINKDAKVVFTVSPLRHLNDGAHGNNLSKATLHLAVEKICSEFSGATADKNSLAVSYFPSYEIVMDELRDYRFYAEDMTHLSNVAEDYIFERMCNVYCTEATMTNMKRVEKFMKTVGHHIEDAKSLRTKEFVQQQIAKAENLETIISGLDLNEEKKYFGQFA